MSLAALVGKAALALGDALGALLLPGARADVVLAGPGDNGGGGAPIGEPDDDEGYVEDDDDDADDEDEDDEDEDPMRVD